MDVILTDIVFAVARAAVATLLAKELYSITIPSLFLFSLITYSVLSRDPIRASLPPYIGFKGVWDVLWGKRRMRNGKREVVRLSIFRRDVFWISKGDAMNELVASGKINPVFYGDGIIIPYGDKEKAAVEKVFLCTFGLSFRCLRLRTWRCFMMLWMKRRDSSLKKFPRHKSLQYLLSKNLFQERYREWSMVLTSCNIVDLEVWDRRIKLSSTDLHIVGASVDSFFLITFRISADSYVIRMRKKRGNLEMFSPLNTNYENKLLNIQPCSRISFSFTILTIVNILSNNARP
jgi:hypothetical protein